MAMPFVGDGNYVGDGGAELQRLWEFAPWKMIANCPGRYTIRQSKRSPMRVDGVPVTSINAQSERCKDPVQAVVFATGGGVITYCKSQTQEHGGGAEMLFIHTLNTASGLERKLRGLQLAHVLDTQ